MLNSKQWSCVRGISYLVVLCGAAHVSVRPFPTYQTSVTYAQKQHKGGMIRALVCSRPGLQAGGGSWRAARHGEWEEKCTEPTQCKQIPSRAFRIYCDTIVSQFANNGPPMMLHRVCHCSCQRKPPKTPAQANDKQHPLFRCNQTKGHVERPRSHDHIISYYLHASLAGQSFIGC